MQLALEANPYHLLILGIIKMGNVVEITGHILDGVNKKSFYLLITSPIKSDDHDEFYYCQIRCPYFFNKEKKIHGIDKNQAIDLSKYFINEFLVGKIIVDEKGNKITI